MSVPELDTSHLGDDQQLTSGVQHSQHCPAPRVEAGPEQEAHVGQKEGNVEDSKNGYVLPSESYLSFLKLPNTPVS